MKAEIIKATTYKGKNVFPGEVISITEKQLKIFVANKRCVETHLPETDKDYHKKAQKAEADGENRPAKGGYTSRTSKDLAEKAAKQQASDEKKAQADAKKK